MEGCPSARCLTRGVLLATCLFFASVPFAAADPLVECVDVFVQPERQESTDVTPVATESQYGVIVTADSEDANAGVFASAQARPSQCASDVPPDAPDEAPPLTAPALPAFDTPDAPALPPEVQHALAQASGLLP